MSKKEIKNPKDTLRMTPLHFAAARGHMKICSVIIQQLLSDNVVDKNPKSDRDWTPLHLAAKYGHLEICKLIMNYVENKNPPNVAYVTPLHLAAMKGHLKICEIIIENTPQKNPGDYSGTTPLHLAAFYKKKDIVNLFTNRIEVSPSDLIGKEEIINTFYKSLDCQDQEEL